MNRKRIPFEKVFKIYVLVTIVFVTIFFEKKYFLPYFYTIVGFYISSIAILFFQLDFKIFLLSFPVSFIFTSIFFRTHLFPEILIITLNRFFYLTIHFLKKYFKDLKIPENLKLMYINIVVLFFLLEIVLNLFYFIKPVDILKRKDEILKLKPGTYFNNEKVNRYGFLGTEFDKPKTKKRVLFIGDSFGVGVVDYKNNFIKMFEDSLGFEVVNLSQPGNSPKDYYEILNDYFDKTSPDMTFIIIFSGNDITEVYYPENNYSLNNLKSMNLIKNFLTLLQLKNVSGDLSEEDFIKVENRRSKILIEDSYDKEWRFFDKNIEYISRFFRERKKKVYFLIIPDQFTVDEVLQKKLLKYSSLQFKEWDFVDRKIEGILKKYGLNFFSLVDTFKICYKNGEELYRRNNTHINERGNYVVFKFLEGRIKEEK
ncbi:MAG: hypothetical protein ABIN00_03290 [candidate division WOR-3 bacterium]